MAENRKLTQCDRIVDYMEKYGSITQDEADKHIGCKRLPSRIHELKLMGYNIHTKMEKGKNRYGDPTHYARYTICK